MLAITLIIPFQNHLLVYALFLWRSRDTVFLEANECLGVKWPVLKRVQVPFLHSSCCCADDEFGKAGLDVTKHFSFWSVIVQPRLLYLSTLLLAPEDGYLGPECCRGG